MDWREEERVTALDYIGLAFMAITSSAMVCLAVWIATL